MANLYWRRVEPGMYVSVSVAKETYTVGRCPTTGEWFAEGPRVDGVYRTKRQAQVVCQLASKEEK